MDSKELLHTIFHSAPSAVFAFVAECWDAHPLITLAVLAAVAYGLYCTVKTVISRPLTLVYLIYGVLSGAVAMRFAMGLIGLDSPSDAAAAALIGAGVGAIVGFCAMLGAAESKSGLSLLTFLLMPIAVVLTAICIFFAVAAVLVLHDNLIAGVLCLAFFGAILAPAEYVVIVFLVRD